MILFVNEILNTLLDEIQKFNFGEKADFKFTKFTILLKATAGHFGKANGARHRAALNLKRFLLAKFEVEFCMANLYT